MAGAFVLALAGALVGCTSGGGYGIAAAAREAAWKVDNGASALRFVTTKNTNVAETQKFIRLSGAIAPGGAVSLVVDLSSVETQVPIRNERMQSLQFEIARFPSAEFKAAVDIRQLGGLALGDSVDLDVPGKFTLHGVSKDITAALRVVRLKNETACWCRRARRAHQRGRVRPHRWHRTAARSDGPAQHRRHGAGDVLGRVPAASLIWRPTNSGQRQRGR